MKIFCTWGNVMLHTSSRGKSDFQDELGEVPKIIIFQVSCQLSTQDTEEYCI